MHVSNTECIILLSSQSACFLCTLKYFCLLRWRIKLKSLSFTWCTSLAVSPNFPFVFFHYKHCGFGVCVFVNSVSHDLAERARLRDGEYPLVTRVLYGPCEKISKIFITEADLGEEVTYDVRVGLVPPVFFYLVCVTLFLFFLLSSTRTHTKTMDQWQIVGLNLASWEKVSCLGTDVTMA